MPQQLTVVANPILSWKYGGNAYRYMVTPSDYVWWVRAIWREGRPQVAVGHTLLQRFAWLYSTNRPYKTLGDFLRAYCQPINPAWLPGGKLSEAKIRRMTAAGNVNAANDERARAAQRAVYSNTPLEQIPSKYRKAADLILSGATRSPIPGAMHFTTSFAAAGDDQQTAEKKAKAYAAKRDLTIVPISQGFKPGVNWFFASPGKQPPKVSSQISRSQIATASVLPLSTNLLPFGVIGAIIALFVFVRKRRN